MKNIVSKWNDQDIQSIVGKLLRYGVVSASIIAFLGGLAYLIHNGEQMIPDYGHFVGEDEAYITLKGILNGVLRLESTEIIQLGIVVLIATPIFRVISSLFAFTLEKDKLYICITLIVLCIIMISIFGGIKG